MSQVVQCVLRFSLRKKKELAEVVVSCVTLFSVFQSFRLFRLSNLSRVVSNSFLSLRSFSFL